MNIPMIYKELSPRCENKMNNVLSFGTYTASIVYIVVGVSGYLTFIDNTSLLQSKNILDAPYKNILLIDIVSALKLMNQNFNFKS